MKVRTRVRKIKLRKLTHKLDNCVVVNGVVKYPKYGWQVQRKFGMFGRWQHFMWTKEDHRHLKFLLDS